MHSKRLGELVMMNTLSKYLIHSIFVLLALFLASGCAPKNTAQASASSTTQQEKKEQIALQKAKAEKKAEEKARKALEESITQKILATAYTQLGKKYRYGGTTPSTGFDCAGFTQWTFAQHGIKLPRTSREQLSFGTPVKKSEIVPGDLLIYSRRIGSRRGTHVGIYVGEGKFIHSPRSGRRLSINDAFDNYRSKRFLGARRVLHDPLAAPLALKKQQNITTHALASNNPGRGKKKPADTTASFAENYTVYRVRGGDTVSGIANRYGVPVRKILAANNLKSKHVLRLGQRVLIPQKQAPGNTIVKDKNRDLAMENAPAFHVVKSGDTVSMLAEKYGVSTVSLLKANRLTKKSVLRLKQKLVIPGKKASSQTTTVASSQAPSTAQATKAPAKKTASPQKSLSTTKQKTHTIASGDTIWKLSRKYGVSEKAMLSANGLSKKSTLRLGQKLVVPGGGKVRTTAQKPNTNITKNVAASKLREHRVQRGDTIWGIAQKYGLSERTLLAANGLGKKHTLSLGQKIIIPAQ